MDDYNTKRRYILITGNDLPPLTCPPEQLLDMLPEFIGHDVLSDFSSASMKWPDTRWWALSDDDLWPSRPILFKRELDRATGATGGES